MTDVTVAMAEAAKALDHSKYSGMITVHPEGLTVRVWHGELHTKKMVPWVEVEFAKFNVALEAVRHVHKAMDAELSKETAA